MFNSFLLFLYFQVYSFSTSLIEAILSFGTKSKIEDASIARTISTQAPSLCHAVEVMVEQCLKRCSTLEESRDFSIKRNNELGERKKIRLKPPPEPPKPVPKKVSIKSGHKHKAPHIVWFTICTALTVACCGGV